VLRYLRTKTKICCVERMFFVVNLVSVMLCGCVNIKHKRNDIGKVATRWSLNVSVNRVAGDISGR
jgi:hypothetical protein